MFYDSLTILGINTIMYLQYLVIPNPNLLLLVELFYLRGQSLFPKLIKNKNRKQNKQANKNPRQSKIKTNKTTHPKLYRTYYPSFKMNLSTLGQHIFDIVVNNYFRPFSLMGVVIFGSTSPFLALVKQPLRSHGNAR